MYDLLLKLYTIIEGSCMWTLHNSEISSALIICLCKLICLAMINKIWQLIVIDRTLTLVKHPFVVNGYEFEITMTTKMFPDYSVEQCCKCRILREKV